MSQPSNGSVAAIDESRSHRDGGRRRSWAFWLLLGVVLGLAAVVQTVARVFDLDWLAVPLVSSVVVGALLVIAVQVPPLRGRLRWQLLDIVAALVPAVRFYVDQRDAATARLRGNAQRMTNLRQIVALNNLQPIPPTRAQALGGASDRDIEYAEMIEQVVGDVFPVAMRTTHGSERLCLALQLLYLDAHPWGDDKQNRWTEHKDVVLEPLTDVLVRTGHVRRTAATWSEVHDGLNALIEFSTGALLDHLSQVSTNEATRMRRVFDRYSIPVLTRTTWTDADWTSIEATAKLQGGNQIARCAKLCAARLRSSALPLSSTLLRLLYLESYSPNNAGFWRKHGAQVVGELAGLLSAGELLPDYVSSEFRRAATLERLIAEHRFYSVELLRDELDALDRLRLTLEDFARFLDGEGFAVGSPTDMGHLLIDLLERHVRGGLPREDRDVERIARADSEMQLLFGYGTDVLAGAAYSIQSATWSPADGATAVTPLPGSLVDGVCLAALHLHVCREGPATPDAHVALARMTRDRAVPARAAALVLAARSHMQTAAGTRVPLHDVVGRWAAELDVARATDPAALRRQIEREQRLVETVTGVTGIPAQATESSAQSTDSTPSDIGTEPVVEQLVEVRDALEGLDGVLREHRSAHLAVTDRIALVTSNVDALTTELHDGREWLVRPYLLTYDKDAGPLAELIDPLAWPDPAQRAALTRLGVRQGDDSPYRFANLTRQTRLGFLPRDVPFDEFLAELERDLDTVLRHREDVLGYRVVRPGATTAITVGGPPPLTVRTMPSHGSVVLDPHRARLDYTPFPIDFRGRDRLVVDDRAGERHDLRLAVRPDLRRIEVTVSRIHLAQFSELVIDHAGQPPIAREPSVLHVVETLTDRGQLDPVELDVIHRHLGQIVGRHAAVGREFARTVDGLV